MKRYTWQEKTKTERLDFSGNDRKIQIRKDKKVAVNSSRTRAAKVAPQKEHTAANRKVRKSDRTDKRDFVEGLAEEAERAADSRNMMQLYDTTKKLAVKFKKSERPIRDKNGTVLTGVDKQPNRCMGRTLWGAAQQTKTTESARYTAS